jgi:PD-(D/E)XK nuclease superfamily
MPLPEGFVFNSNSIQDFVECQRRFQLRYMDHLFWPAVEVEPFEKYEHMLDQDTLFHKIIHQHLNGVPADQITGSLEGNAEVQNWWENFQQSMRDGILEVLVRPGNRIYEEIDLSVPVGDFRLTGHYDLLLAQPDGKLVIMEWMIAQKKPERGILNNRYHTLIAQFILAGSASNLIGGHLANPNQIEMIYWFANFPHQPEQFQYSPSIYEQDSRQLSQLIKAIHQKTEPIFSLTPDVNRCLFCNYRSFCDRGDKAGEFDHWVDWLATSTGDASPNAYQKVSEIDL